MTQVWKGLAYLILAELVTSVSASHYSGDLILPLVVWLSLGELRASTIVLLVAAAIVHDLLSLTPLGAALLSYAAIFMLIQALKSKVYLHTVFARWVWCAVAVMMDEIIGACVVSLRQSMLVWDWSAGIRVLLRGTIAWALLPVIGYWMRWRPMRRKDRIVS